MSGFSRPSISKARAANATSLTPTGTSAGGGGSIAAAPVAVASARPSISQARASVPAAVSASALSPLDIMLQSAKKEEKPAGGGGGGGGGDGGGGVEKIGGGSLVVKLCFIVDCTASMGYAIESVMERIDSITADAEAKFPGVVMQFAFVGYRDWNGDGSVPSSPHMFEVVPFTSDYGAYAARLSSVKADSPSHPDVPENVLGGMDEALKLDWSNARVSLVFHIGDAPHHGARFHDWGSGSDRNMDKEASPRSADDIVADFAEQKIDYYFIQVATGAGEVQTTKMLAVFKTLYNASAYKRRDFTIFDFFSEGFTNEALFSKICEGITSSVNASLGRALGRK